jgi:hypothetical protein
VVIACFTGSVSSWKINIGKKSTSVDLNQTFVCQVCTVYRIGLDRFDFPATEFSGSITSLASCLAGFTRLHKGAGNGAISVDPIGVLGKRCAWKIRLKSALC